MKRVFLLILISAVWILSGCMVNQSGPSFVPTPPGSGWDFGEKLSLNSRFVSSPVLIDNRIFQTSLDGNIYVFDSEKGKKFYIPGNNKEIFVNAKGRRVFINDKGKEEEPRQSMFRVPQGIRSTPAFRNGILYFGSFDKKMRGIDVITGQERFTFVTGGYISADPVIDADVLYFGAYDGILRALDLSSSRVKWQYDSKNPIKTKVAITAETVIVVDEKGNLTCLKREDGSLVWRIETGSNTYSAPVFSEDLVVVAGLDGYVRAFKVADGSKFWEFVGEPGDIKYKEQFWTTPVIADGVVFIGSTWGRFYAIKLRPETSVPTSIWTQPFSVATEMLVKARMSESILSDAIVAGDKVIFGANDGILYCLNTLTGEKLWSFTTLGEIRGKPLIDNDRVIFVSNDHYLYGLNLQDGTPIRGQGQ